MDIREGHWGRERDIGEWISGKVTGGESGTLGSEYQGRSLGERARHWGVEGRSLGERGGHWGVEGGYTGHSGRGHWGGGRGTGELEGGGECGLEITLGVGEGTLGRGTLGSGGWGTFGRDRWGRGHWEEGHMVVECGGDSTGLCVCVWGGGGKSGETAGGRGHWEEGHWVLEGGGECEGHLGENTRERDREGWREGGGHWGVEGGRGTLGGGEWGRSYICEEGWE